MTSMAFESQVDRALRRRGTPISTQEFLAVLEEVSSIAVEPLTAGEQDFLLRNTDLTEAGLPPRSLVATNLKVLAGQASSRARLRENSLSTAEVASLIGRDPANVRRSRLEGALYSLGDGVPGQSLRFPSWQFVGGAPLPGLRMVIPAFPTHFHPLSIERFMTTANDDLDGMTPVEWLAMDGAPDAVAKLADELGYE